MTSSQQPPEDTVSFTLDSQETVMYRRGDRIGESYSLVSLIAVGGMGVVYKAKHLQLDKLFALKLLEPRQMTEASWRRFEFEARTLAKLKHPNIVEIFNMGIDQRGCPYCVMELLTGVTVSEYLNDAGKMSLRQFVQCFTDVCSALEQAHGKNIVHRDIKPSNLILVDSESEIKSTKVVDFGIAKSIEIVDQQTAQSLTIPGQLFGTPLYMSPEQIQGLPINVASDIYSLGCTMFEAFTGSPPFRGETILDTMLMHQSADIPEIYRDDCSDSNLEEVAKIIERCMAKNASERFENVKEIARALADVSIDVPATGIAWELEKPNSSVNEDESPHTKRKSIYIIGASLAILFSFTYAVSTMVTGVVQKSKQVEAKVKAPEVFVSKMPDLDLAQKAEGEWLSETKPISTLKNQNGKRFREFNFPKDVKVGLIVINNAQHSLAAIGTIRASEAPVRFEGGQLLGSHPEFYNRFDNHAIQALIVKSAESPPAVATLKNWKYLSTLDYAGSYLSDSYVRELGDLDHLDDLTLAACRFTEDALVASGVLARLNKFAVSHIPNCSKIISGLAAQSHKLEYLTVRSVKLSAADFKSITALPRLCSLDLRGSEFPAGSLSVLSGAKSLTALHLEGSSKYTLEDLEKVVTIPRLTLLTVAPDVLKSEDLRHLKRLNPATTVIRKAPD